MAYKYDGFFRSMDTLRDWQILQDMVERGETPWLRRKDDDYRSGGLKVALP